MKHYHVTSNDNQCLVVSHREAKRSAFALAKAFGKSFKINKSSFVLKNGVELVSISPCNSCEDEDVLCWNSNS
jgi:hypothetical protein